VARAANRLSRWRAEIALAIIQTAILVAGSVAADSAAAGCVALGRFSARWLEAGGLTDPEFDWYQTGFLPPSFP
jgi:hypothetical protein